MDFLQFIIAMALAGIYRQMQLRRRNVKGRGN